MAEPYVWPFEGSQYQPVQLAGPALWCRRCGALVYALPDSSLQSIHDAFHAELDEVARGYAQAKREAPDGAQ